MGCWAPNVTEAPAPETAKAPPIVLTGVNVGVLSVERAFSRDAEFRGLVTVALELGLSDIPGVVPRVVGHSVPPAFLIERPVISRQVDATFTAKGEPDDLMLELELCVPGGSCAAYTAPATSAAPWEAMGVLLDGAAETLGVLVPEATHAAWRKPGSNDPYAELITGRAAAQLYGLLPPSDKPGDRRDDPVLRALFLDPGQPLAHWIRARWEMASTLDGGQAPSSLAKAELLRPTSPLLSADRATLASLLGKNAEALLVWETLVALRGNDPRWIAPLARAYLAVDRPDEALAALARLPDESTWDAEIAELRVSASERSGVVELDPLLERWQSVASALAAPVERRIGLRVDRGEYASALALLPVLRSRSAGPTTDALEVSLLLALARYEDAAALAPADVAERIRARRSLELDPASPVQLSVNSGFQVLVQAYILLQSGNALGALSALDQEPSSTGGSDQHYALRARALDALGRSEDAAITYVLAWEIDPASTGGPVEAGRIASTFRYVEAGDYAGADRAVPTGGPKGPTL